MKIKQMTDKQTAKIKRALYALSVTRFQYQSSDAKRNAQLNLLGKSHYVDEDTLRFFKARILRSGEVDYNGFLFYLVESIGSKEEEPRKNKRFVVIDAFGECLTDHEQYYKTTDQALQACREWVREFDLAGHYFKRIKERAKRLKTQATDANKALR